MSSFHRRVDFITVLSSFELSADENGCSLVACQFENDDKESYVVGTAVANENEPEPDSGRILVLEVENRKLVLVSEYETNGAVYSLVPFNEMLLAGINNKVLDSQYLHRLKLFQVFLLAWDDKQAGQSSSSSKVTFLQAQCVVSQFFD